MNADGSRLFAVRLNVAGTATSLPRIAAGLLIADLVTLGGPAADL